MTFDAVDMQQRLARRKLSNEELFKKRKNRRMVTLFEKECDVTCGAHWLVKSSDIFIQYMSSARYATIQGLAIGGSFLQGHSLVIDSKGLVTWDGKRIADSTTSSFKNELIRLKIFEQSYWQRSRRPKTMNLELPSRVTLKVNLGSIGKSVFKHFLDVFIMMPIPMGGTDGYCGDADGDVRDETKQRVFQRAQAGDLRVAPVDNLFDRELSHKVLLDEQSSSTVAKRATLRDEEVLEPLETLECMSGSVQEALLNCSSRLPNGTTDDFLEACAVDVCIGGEDMLNHSAMIAAQSEEIVEEELAQAEAEAREACHTCGPGDDCFNDVKWAMDVGIPTGFYAERGWALDVNESSCFEEVQRELKAWQALSDFAAGMSDKRFLEPCNASSEGLCR